MQSEVKTVKEYMDALPGDRKAAIDQLRKVIKRNLPKGYEEVMSYGMIGYVVPHSIYPAGYHCAPELPLPFINIASQKNFIAIYHMGIYANKELMDWFLAEYAKLSDKKPDMGKSCIRFKNPGQIPFELIGALSSKVSVEQWIQFYEDAFKKNKSRKT